MATSLELLREIEVFLDELEGDLSLPAGVNVPTDPLPTLKQMMVVLEPRLRAIALAVPPGGSVKPPEIDLDPVLQAIAAGAVRRDELGAQVLLMLSTLTGKIIDAKPIIAALDALTAKVIDARPILDAISGAKNEILAALDVSVEPPSPPANRAPTWPAGETVLEFVSGVPKVVPMKAFPTDADGDSLLLAKVSGTLQPGFTYDEATDEVRYDGRPLPAGAYGAFTVSADDGRG